MNAREKLNVAQVNGSLVVAAVIGVVSQSWSVFLATVLLLVGVKLASGHIRPGPRTPQRSADQRKEEEAS